jgi:hypothetical protein
MTNQNLHFAPKTNIVKKQLLTNTVFGLKNSEVAKNLVILKQTPTSFKSIFRVPLDFLLTNLPHYFGFLKK